ncbi:MAG TPA: CehA/McbA family metallohydrolase [Pirellulales bacterium]|nr:CehA/McbA family metallohydrolase [Pirellulales bacterium]
MAICAVQCTAVERTLDKRMHHLRSGDEREWAKFPEEAEGNALTVTFAADPADGPHTLRVRHRDVKQTWRLRLNDQNLGSLPPDENDITTFWEIPPSALRPGDNQLAIEGDGRPSDDIEVGDLRLIDRTRREALSAATLNVVVTDAQTGHPVPSRVTVVDENGSLMTIGAESSKRLAVRPGVLYTADGMAEFGLPAEKYTVYAGRGFEYSVDVKQIEVAPGQPQVVRLAIRREVPMPGFVSCDTHVHTLTYSGHGDATLDERLVTLAGEGVELSIATDHNVKIDYRKALESSGLSTFYTPVVGNEVTTRVGHFNVFPLDADGPLIDVGGTSWPAVSNAIDAKEGRVVVLNHPRDVHGGFRPFAPARHLSLAGEELDGWELPANAMELVNSGALQTDPWRLVYDWFGLLNAGHRITPVGSSDSHDVARSIVGQARTYIRCHDDQPGKISVAEAVGSLLAGRVLVSFGLAADVEVNGRYGPGDLVSAASCAELDVRVRVLGPSWSDATEVVLFVNGSEARREKPPQAGHARIKYDSIWTIPRPRRDAHLVVVAIGPGVSNPYWPTAKPYQPDSPEWAPYTLGVTGAVYIDADDTAGYTSPRAYALELARQAAGDIKRLASLLADYDEAVTVQAAAVLHQRGELTDSTVKALLGESSSRVRAAVARYLDALRQGERRR